jgi:hypothetical protein
MSDFAGDWWRHGFNLTINSDGSANATWRTYHWCSDSIPGACDRIDGNTITNGGYATLSFTGGGLPNRPRDWQPDAFARDKPIFSAVQLPIAHGSVLTSTDPSRLHIGLIDLALLPYETGALTQDGDGVLICRPTTIEGININDMTPAQREAFDHRACGA